MQPKARSEITTAAPDDRRALGDPGTPAFRVELYPFYLINRLASLYNATIEPKLRAIGLDIPNWRVLMILGEREPRGVRDIADAAVIPLSTMTRIVQRMAAAGLVEAKPSERDARVTLVSLTDAGTRKLAEARASTSGIYRRLIDGMTGEDFDRFVTLINTMHDNLIGRMD
ncbi:MarR family winged helix-turn-helix transcriptional regulator [Sphingomonas sp.]